MNQVPLRDAAGVVRYVATIRQHDNARQRFMEGLLQCESDEKM
jgi:hypothetical protein